MTTGATQDEAAAWNLAVSFAAFQFGDKQIMIANNNPLRLEFLRQDGFGMGKHSHAPQRSESHLRWHPPDNEAISMINGD